MGILNSFLKGGLVLSALPPKICWGWQENQYDSPSLIRCSSLMWSSYHLRNSILSTPEHCNSATVLLRSQYSLDLKSWKTFLLVSHCFPWDRDSSLYLVNIRTQFLKRKTIQIPILCLIFVFTSSASRFSNLVTSNVQLKALENKWHIF